MPCNTGQSLLEVSRLRDEGYLPIFTYQWTESYLYHPLPAQIAGFHRPIDAGAVIVSGSQAHQPMGFEFYKDGFIHYGPGNLFFDQMWSLPTRQEFVDRHIFYDGRHISTELLTALLENWSKPRPMTDAERAAFLTTMFRESGWY
jgi:poly-gamma-glutamate synthesis protein (capsule biosynthesis protein)